MHQTLMKLLCFISGILISHHCLANPMPTKTIFDTRVNWQNNVEKKSLLNRAPKWPLEAIHSIYNSYQSTKLPATTSDNQYNIQFINAYWGPRTNPFNAYSRPAKLFLFPNHSSSTFYMAPLIQDKITGQFYVYDNNQTKPILAEEWVAQIKKTHHTNTLFFNVCDGYGNFPTDSCQGKNYQQETTDAYHNNTLLKNAVTPSAARSPYENWQVNAYRYQMLSKSKTNPAVMWDDVKERNQLLNTVPSWHDHQIIEDNFKKIRDLRYFEDEEKSNFSRRITWLFPDDGCWTRGAAVIKDLFGPENNAINPFPRPAKIFAFGNLCANTTNSAHGKVNWWYHTAPIIRDQVTNQSYVLDPSINPNQPLTTEEWIEAITATTGQCAATPGNIKSFSICNGYGSNPFDDCNSSDVDNFSKEVNATLNQSPYRAHERERQAELGRDTDKVLGDQPPWLMAK